MRYLLLFVFCHFFLPIDVLACGPSPQKVVKQITVQASPAVVWAVVGNVGAMQDWHPAIESSTVKKELKKTQGAEANETVYRTLLLVDGGRLMERLRPLQANTMKVGVVIEQGSLAVSNYSDALTVKPGLETDTAIVTWTGRFNNKANLLVAPKGQDNEAALLAVNQFYEVGLNGLKHFIEASSSEAH